MVKVNVRVKAKNGKRVRMSFNSKMQAAKHFKVPYHVVNMRTGHLGWTLEDALTTPVRPWKRAA